MPKIADYEGIIGAEELAKLKRLAEGLCGLSLLHINSAKDGGGVAEMLHSLVPLFNELGLKTRWEAITGTPLFFHTTKSFHNALQGAKVEITPEMLEEYKRVNRQNAERLDLHADLVMVHDPQPAALIEHRDKGRWIWRCHIDLSRPDRGTWALLAQYLKRYDAAVFSMEEFIQALPIPQFIVPPSIDPLSDKNRELPPARIDEVYEKYGINRDKPIILQVSRFDRFKDPLGVIEVYRLVRKEIPCRLVLAGGAASDDPEGAEVYQEVRRAAAREPEVHVLDLPPRSDIEINALQRGADVIIQKSLREGFGLTVTEALWKGKPVVATAVGGIRLQVIDGRTGLLVNSIPEAADRVKHLLRRPELARELGEAGREHVRKNFLITRHLRDYLRIYSSLLLR
ncbi:MAG: glycosyltransferase [Candidatus Bipolaricaulia bacterium]